MPPYVRALPDAPAQKRVVEIAERWLVMMQDQPEQLDQSLLEVVPVIFGKEKLLLI